MKHAIAAISIAALTLTAASALHAESITCNDSSGNPVLTTSISAVHVDTNSVFTFFFSVQVPIAQYNYLLYSEYETAEPFSTCVVTPGNGTSFGSATITDVTADINSAEQVATATFTFDFLYLGPESAKISPSKKAQLTADQKQEALDRYLARLPQAMKSKQQ